MEELDPEILSVFFDEADEHLRRLNDALMQIEEAGLNRALEPDQVDSIFRSFHSLKGASGMMGLTQINALTHCAENVWDQIRQKRRILDAKTVQLLFESLDALTQLIEQVKSGADESVEIAHLVKRLESLEENIADAESELSPETPQVPQEIQKFLPTFVVEVREHLTEIETLLAGDQEPNLDELFRGFHQIKASLALVGYQRLSTATHEAESLLDKCRSESKLLSRDERTLLLRVSDAISKSLDLLENDTPEENTSKKEGVDITGEPRNRSNETMRVDLNRLGELMNLAGELVIGKARFIQFGKTLKSITSLRGVMLRMGDLIRDLDGSIEQADVKDRVENIRESLMPIQKIVSEFKEYEDAVRIVDVLSSRLQTAVMDLRMIPVGPFFGRFKRVVRDICAETGKEVILELKGEETEVDKKMLDELVDPLTHMVRNAVDHGVESPEERENIGKDRSGRVVLSAIQRSGRIEIRMKDDGRGINIDRVKQKALEKNLITEEGLKDLSPREAMNLIFAPGFSTAEKLTTISGRGVGMDIVKKKIEELKGRVEIRSEEGAGTEFSIYLPLTLATQKSLLIQASGEVMAIPLESVQEIVSASEVSMHQVNGQKMIRVRKDVVPACAFYEVLSNLIKEEELNRFYVIVREGEFQLGLHAEKLIGEQEILIKSLSDNLGVVPGISGVSILADGGIALIPDLSHLIQKFHLEEKLEAS